MKPRAAARLAPLDPATLAVVEALARRQARLDYEASQSPGGPSVPRQTARPPS